MKRTFKSRLNHGDVLIGTIITLPAPEIAEIYAHAGFDWLFVDLEHSVLSLREAQTILQAVSLQTTCLVRVPAVDETWIKKVLDIGAAGIIIPQVKTAEEVRKAIQLCKYPPDGSRSVGLGRAQGYGANLKEYVAQANDETIVIVQIEHVDAVKNLEEIVKIPGIDGLFVGPYDLSASMGKIGEIADPEVQAAIAQVKKVAMEMKLPLGIFGAAAETVKPFIEEGYTFLAVGIDTMLIAQTARKILEGLHSETQTGGCL